MNLLRRRFLHLAAGAAALPVVSRIAWAQAYPSRPVRIIVGFPAGGPGDIVTRLMGQWLSERLGQPVIVENRAGAAGNIGTEAVVRAPADGYTLLLTTVSNAVNATLYDKLNFNFIRDVAPVAGVVRVPNVMEVNPSFPAKTAPEFIAYAKANPNKLNFGSGGNGTASHMQFELFKLMSGVSPRALSWLFSLQFAGVRRATWRTLDPSSSPSAKHYPSSYDLSRSADGAGIGARRLDHQHP